MGYTTEFDGYISIDPPLNDKELSYLKKFNNTRRMKSTLGPYYVDRGGPAGQDHTPDIIDYNHPPEDQPSLWCQWTPNDNGSSIVWDEGEKFYSSAEWMEYLIEHFIGSDPTAKKIDPDFNFLEGHTLNGTIEAQGEDPSDHWLLIVENNKIYIQEYTQKLGRKRKLNN